MTKDTKSKLQMMGAWCGFWYLVVLLVGWGLIAGCLPPLHPSAGPDDVASIFQANTFRIRVGMIMTMFVAMIFIPFGAVLSQYLARVEGGPGVLAYSSLLGAAGNMCLTFYPPTYWLIACFRPDRAPELQQLLSDVAWLQFIGGVSLFLAMPLCMIVAAFTDTSPNPVFPRWSGYAISWMCLMIIPDQLLFFFHGGPFAWNGLFGFWIPLGGLGGWYLLTFILLRSAVLRDRQGVAP